jgi:hypothetical protein
MWSAFVTGMAEKATSLIDERDKEIQEKIDKQLEKMYQDAAVTKKKAELRRDTLESTARELMTLGVSQEQAATLLQNVGPEGAANMVERLKSAKQVTPEKIRAALSQVKTSEAPLDEVIARQTTPTATEVQAPQMRGAFGLPSRAGKEFAETARGIETELPAIPTTAQPLDLSVFEEEEEEAFSKRKNAARIKVLDAKTPGDRNAAIEELSSIAAIEDIGVKNKSEEGFKESNIRSNIRNFINTINESMAGPGSSLVRLQNEDGSYRYGYAKGTKKEDIVAIEQLKRNAVESYLKQFYSVEGSIPTVVRKVAEAFLATPGQRLLTPPASSPEASKPADSQAGIKKEGGSFYIVDPASPGRVGPFKTQKEALEALDMYKKQRNQ